MVLHNDTAKVLNVSTGNSGPEVDDKREWRVLWYRSVCFGYY